MRSGVDFDHKISISPEPRVLCISHTHSNLHHTGEPNSEINKSANYPTCRLPLVETKKKTFPKTMYRNPRIFPVFAYSKICRNIAHGETFSKHTYLHPLPTRDRAQTLCAQSVYFLDISFLGLHTRPENHQTGDSLLVFTAIVVLINENPTIITTMCERDTFPNNI